MVAAAESFLSGEAGMCFLSMLSGRPADVHLRRVASGGEEISPQIRLRFQSIFAELPLQHQGGTSFAHPLAYPDEGEIMEAGSVPIEYLKFVELCVLHFVPALLLLI